MLQQVAAATLLPDAAMDVVKAAEAADYLVMTAEVKSTSAAGFKWATTAV